MDGRISGETGKKQGSIDRYAQREMQRRDTSRLFGSEVGQHAPLIESEE